MPADLENCDPESAELTDEETDYILRTATQMKRAAIKLAKYTKVLGQEKKSLRWTHSQYWDFYLKMMAKSVGGMRCYQNINERIVKILCLYFSEDEKVKEYGLDLNKGLMLVGPVGCGKTSIMRIFAANHRFSYRVVSCRKIASMFSIAGHEVLERYSSASRLTGTFGYKIFDKTLGGWCFDDLGTEEKKNNYGNKMNVMESVLLDWYDNDHRPVHVTTNLSGSQLKEHYGDRLASRMIEMFNIIEFDKDAKDMRRG